MDISTKSRKEVGAIGEAVAAEYLGRHGIKVVERNLVRKMGEIDLVGKGADTLHFVEVKTILCDTFPTEQTTDEYDPSLNLHEAKIRKVARMGEWYVAEKDWDGEWQVDGVLVWLRRSDGMAKVRYLPQIV
jgi:putative endonuclease